MIAFKNLKTLKNKIVSSAAVLSLAAVFAFGGVSPSLAAETGEEISLPDDVKKENVVSNSASADNIVSGSFSAPNKGTLTLTYIADLENKKAYISGASYSGSSTFSLNRMPKKIEHPVEGSDSVTCDVEGINDSAFRGVSSYITGISIPETYKSIGANAFYGCKKITGIGLTEGLETIGSRAFYGCTSLSGSVTIPSTVKNVGEGAFAYCTSLESISCNYGSNYYTSKDGILYSYDEKTIVAVPAGKSFGTDDSYEIESPTKVINVLAFAGCTKLKYLDNVAETLTSVGERAFEGCTALLRATMPAGVSYIGTDAFKGCNSALVITCTKSATSVVEDYCKSNKISSKIYCIVTFYDDKGTVLSQQTILYGNDAVAPTVTVPSGYTMQWNKSYVNITDSIDIKLVLLKNITVTFKDLNGTGQVTEVATCYGQTATPPQWTREGFVLGWDSDAYIYPTKNLTINAVWMISLTGVPVEETPVKIGDTRNVDGITYMVTRASENDARVKVVSCSKKTLKTVKIPATVTFGGKSFKVTNIGKNAFRSMEKLTTLDIGSNVVTIGTKAFYNCQKLKSITVRSKKLKNVNEKAFTKTSSSAKVNVPNSLILKYRVYLTDAGLSKTAKVV